MSDVTRPVLAKEIMQVNVAAAKRDGEKKRFVRKSLAMALVKRQQDGNRDAAGCTQ
jgi:hypothetical protein